MPVRSTALSLAIAALPALLGASPVNHSETYSIMLTGLAEGVGGDPNASGKARIVIDAARKRICYDFELSGIASPMMAHIHRAPPMHNGPTVVTLFTEIGGDLKGCKVWTPKQLAAIVARPADYYVNLYTTEFPDGAVRGQLA